MSKLKFKYNREILIPKTKSVGISMENSLGLKRAIERGQSYLYYIGFHNDKNGGYHELNTKYNGAGYRLFFSERDIIGVNNKSGW